MKPIRYLLFLILTLSICIAILLAFPKQGIQINNKFTINFFWNVFNKSDSTPTYADISNIMDKYTQEIANDTDSASAPLPSVITKTETDSTQETTPTPPKVKLQKKRIQNIEYPSGDSTILNVFFAKLNNAQKKRVRILHYGDSQIEGDRISRYLRNKMQKQFGGSGPGLVPALPRHAPSSSIIHKASGNWRQYAIFKKYNNKLNNNNFGILGCFSNFNRYYTDTTNTKNIQAWVRFKKTNMAYNSVKHFTQCKVFFNNAKYPFSVKGFVNGELKWFEDIKPTNHTNTFKWNFETSPKQLRIEWETTQSPDIYAIALDAETGVAVDNIPFRGSSCPKFSKIDYTQAKQMAKQINSGLIILQFGVNVVPNIKKNYNFYERILNREIQQIKKIFGNTPILIVSLSDMSRKEGMRYVSYPNIGKIKQAQWNAAKKNNCAFWDLHTAMGGENSMSEWVKAKPSLATKDFIHFNHRGGNLVAKMIFDALMTEYNKYNHY